MHRKKSNYTYNYIPYHRAFWYIYLSLPLILKDPQMNAWEGCFFQSFVCWINIRGAAYLLGLRQRTDRFWGQFHLSYFRFCIGTKSINKCRNTRAISDSVLHRGSSLSAQKWCVSLGCPLAGSARIKAAIRRQLPPLQWYPLKKRSFLHPSCLTPVYQLVCQLSEVLRFRLANYSSLLSSASVVAK